MNKRIAKKRNKQKLKVELQSRGYNNLSYNQMISVKNDLDKKANRKNKKNELRRRKVSILENNGISRTNFTLSEIDKLKIKDLERGILPDVISKGFDFNQIYTLKNGDVLQIAYRDFAKERSLESIIKEYSRLSNDQLLAMIRDLNNLTPTYSRKTKSSSGNSSNGAAGDYLFLCGKKESAIAKRKEVRKEKYKTKAKLANTDTNAGYQFIKSGGKTYSNEITPRNILILTAGIMSNVTEWNRVAFYNRIYNDLIVRHIPELAEFLPTPQKY